MVPHKPSGGISQVMIWIFNKLLAESRGPPPSLFFFGRATMVFSEATLTGLCRLLSARSFFYVRLLPIVRRVFFL